MHLVDVHAHLDHQAFKDDLDTVLKRANANGVVCVIAQGVNHESNRRVLELAERHESVQAALGLYPSEAANVRLSEGVSRTTAYDVETTLAHIEKNKDKLIAIGEVGIDLKESEDRDTQVENFRQIVRLAKRLRKPLIIHSRKAEQEVLDVLEEENCTRAVMHCFMGSKKLLLRGVEMGLYFSIPTSVVRNEQFQGNVALIPVSQLFTETDAPYMGPMKDIRNEPANIRDAVLKIAELKRMDAGELANQLYFNFQKLFQ